MKAYELLEQKGWCQGSSAKTADGTLTFIEDTEAASFCLGGALVLCYNTQEEIYKNLKNQLNMKLNGIERWNDSPERTKEEVIAVLKKLDI